MAFSPCCMRLLPRRGSGDTSRPVFCRRLGRYSQAPDVFSCVYVRVDLVAAFLALEPALGSSVLGVCGPALGTGPAGVRGQNGHKGALVPGAFKFQLETDAVPALEQDGPIEAGFLPDPGSGVFQRSFGGAGHVADGSVFDGGQLVVFYQLGGNSVLEALG